MQLSVLLNLFDVVTGCGGGLRFDAATAPGATSCDTASPMHSRSEFADPHAHRLDCHWRAGYYVG